MERYVNVKCRAFILLIWIPRVNYFRVNYSFSFSLSLSLSLSVSLSLMFIGRSGGEPNEHVNLTNGLKVTYIFFSHEACSLFFVSDR